MANGWQHRSLRREIFSMDWIYWCVPKRFFASSSHAHKHESGARRKRRTKHGPRAGGLVERAGLDGRMV